ncbi:hypothetical protein QC764_503040 [Podospora pseudoanserina]|uniref:Uncharacterized protein n=1 Tax=Podospora pseudoanserina TaxID=2609844 RepID=A0ABR0I4P7_9PEZI|nr:hypothetical protein QC764_503040 [Podospora pseudoanserina]
MYSESKDRVAHRGNSPFVLGAMSSALVETNNETQVQPYTPAEQAANRYATPKFQGQNTTSYSVMVEAHNDEPLHQRLSTAQDTPHDKGPKFLDWVQFEEATLPPRETARKSRLEKIFSPLNSVKAELPGHISIEGFGGIAETTHNLFRSVKKDDFMRSERIIHLPKSAVDKASKRELERLENELFDLTKYNGDSCDYLTVVTWAEEGMSGTVTLFRVIFEGEDEIVGLQPVAAMQNVPNPVLVKMRTHERIQRKAVFVPADKEAETFKWTATSAHSRGRKPSYVRLEGGNSDDRRPFSPALRDLRSTSHSRSHSRHGALADADGVRATVPQFVALMHGHRALLEEVESSSTRQVITADGEALPAVTLLKRPRSNPHEGDSVHVAVLVPDQAAWADREMLWIGEGILELRKRKYWGLIERPRSRSRNRSRSRSRSGSRDQSQSRMPETHSRHSSGDHARRRSRSRIRSRSRSHYGHDSRSRSRHLALDPFL